MTQTDAVWPPHEADLREDRLDTADADLAGGPARPGARRRCCATTSSVTRRRAPRSLPVMLIPGFLTGDAQMGTLASWLRRVRASHAHLGHSPERRLLGGRRRAARAAPGGMGRAGGRARGRDRPEPRRPVRARARRAAAGPRQLGRDARLPSPRSARGAPARVAAGRRDRRPGGARRAGAGQPPLPQRRLLRAVHARTSRRRCPRACASSRSTPSGTASSTGRCASIRTRSRSRCGRPTAAWR